MTKTKGDAMRKAYLAALEANGGDVPEAMETAGVTYKFIKMSRRNEPGFVKWERHLCKDPTLWKKTAYLTELQSAFGNKTKARRVAKVTPEEVQEWYETDKQFVAKENEIYESFVDLANEQNVRLMVGADCKVRDTAHLRWALAKVDPRWEEKPKVLEHRYGGSVTVKDTRDRIKELLRPEDVVDGELIEQ